MLYTLIRNTNVETCSVSGDVLASGRSQRHEGTTPQWNELLRSLEAQRAPLNPVGHFARDPREETLVLRPRVEHVLGRGHDAGYLRGDARCRQRVFIN